MCQYLTDYESNSHYLKDCEDFKRADYKLSVILDAMKRIIPELYGSGELDEARIDDAIGEICDTLDMKMPCGLPRVRRQRSDIFEFAVNQ